MPLVAARASSLSRSDFSEPIPFVVPNRQRRSEKLLFEDAGSVPLTGILITYTFSICLGGGKRAGAGRKSDRPRKIVCYRIATEVADNFWATCFCLRVPPAAMLEEILDQWCREHENDLLAGYKKLKANKAAFMRQPVSKTNIEALRQAELRREIEAIVTRIRKGAAGKDDAERRQKIRANVASACIFLVKKGRDPRTATTQEIIEILGLQDLCTVKEIATAYKSLVDSGDIARIIREQSSFMTSP
jgi:hypothetical protein